MIIKLAQSVIDTEVQGLKRLRDQISDDFIRAVHLLAKCKGRVIVTGLGKTGLIGRKIASTFSSTGTPALWLHAAEALHGDLGQVTGDDVVMLISYSGESNEVKSLIPLIKKMGNKSIAITGNPKSSLGKYCDIVLNVAVKTEGCPLGLAPMASTTATLALGDALAACLIKQKGFCREDFAFYHPGGSLGRNLLLKVEDIMRKDQHYAMVDPSAVIKDVLLAVTKARCGSACVVDRNRRLVGIFTDGDLRRHLKEGFSISTVAVKDVMTKKPTTVRQDCLAAEAMRILQEKHIDDIPVIDARGKSVGLLDVQDLLKAGIV